MNSRIGLILGTLAVIFWSFGSAFLYTGVKELHWLFFVSITTFIAGFVLLIFHRLHHGQFRSAVVLPAKLWIIVLSGFVLYELLFPLAFAMAKSPQQVYAINLINYLWPVITIIFSVFWVPNTRFSPSLFLAILLAVGALVVANYKQIGLSEFNLLPYILVFLAAIAWAFYSAFLARWTTLAKNYTTSATAFLVTSVITGTLAIITGNFAVNITSYGLLMIFLYALGPLAAGYLLWEKAIAHAKVHSLSLIGSATPILSMLVLCIFLQYLPGPELIIAAIMISAGVVLSIKH